MAATSHRRLLLLFGMRWLRKAILRCAGLIPYHDETAIFVAGTRDLAAIPGRSRADWVALITTFKAMLLEGLEVVFIVIAVGAGPAFYGRPASVPRRPLRWCWSALFCASSPSRLFCCNSFVPAQRRSPCYEACHHCLARAS
jgi:hypothetical protein